MPRVCKALGETSWAEPQVARNAVLDLLPKLRLDPTKLAPKITGAPL